MCVAPPEMRLLGQFSPGPANKTPPIIPDADVPEDLTLELEDLDHPLGDCPSAGMAGQTGESRPSPIPGEFEIHSSSLFTH